MLDIEHYKNQCEQLLNGNAELKGEVAILKQEIERLEGLTDVQAGKVIDELREHNLAVQWFVREALGRVKKKDLVTRLLLHAIDMLAEDEDWSYDD